MRKPWSAGGVGRFLVWVLAIVGLGAGCGDPLATTNALLTFSLEVEDNPGLLADADGVIDEVTDTVAVVVPAGTDVTALVPTFTTDGTKVVVLGVQQISGETAVDFTTPVTYRVISANLTSHEYVVTVATVPRTTKDITSFAFFDATNPALSADAVATINGDAIAATVPFGTDVTALIPTFVHTGTLVSVGGTAQVSGMTANNFASPVTYTVTAGDGSTRAYVVTVTVAPSSAKDLTALAFLDATNAALATDVTATINGTAIAATVPFGTNVSALIATFTTTGQTVSVGATPQVSGTTPNDFTSPVTYVVTAADATTTTYTVTVTISSADQKDITAFAFLSANNAGLPADVTATINGTAIAVTVPTGTNVSALVATFSQTGVSIAVGATPQVSSVTANDFTSPVLYVVTAGDASIRTYTVTVTVALGTAKDITAYAFLDVPNSALSADVTATITGTAITATVPFGTDATSLVATFTHTGSTVAVGVIPQTSGVTPNDFTSPVTYTVTAADNSTQTYTVTVVIAANTAKDIMAFSFPDATNPALSADVTAAIAGTVITATVPFGTDVTGLVATFTHTGTTVTVGATTQASGITPNDFTSPVSYVVTAADSSTRTYTVTVTIAPNTAKDISAFSFLDVTNPALAVDVIATITGTAITADVPPGTDVTALIATFSTGGASVAVGATTQTSGMTPNDFTSPVSYVVTAADTSTQTYTVTVRTIRRFALPRLRATAPSAATPIDTFVRMAYGRIAAPASARVELRIYAANGTILSGPNGALCDPCSADLGASLRGLTVSVGARASTAGLTTAVDAYGVVDVFGDNAPVAVSALTSTQVVAGSNTVIDQAAVIEPPATATQRLLLGPGTEAPGAPSTAGNHDTRLTILNTAGAAAQSATVALRLYGTNGALLPGSVAPICNPCNFMVDATTPRVEVTIDALRTAAGVTSSTQTFLGVLDVSGAGAGQVAVIAERELGTTTTPSVISRSGVPVRAERPATAPTMLRFVTPVYEHRTTHDHVLEITSFSGLGGALPTATVTHDVFDDTSGVLMLADNATPVCSGCGGTIGGGFQRERSTVASMASPQAVTPPRAGYVVTEISGAAAPGIFASTTTQSLVPGIESTHPLEERRVGTAVRTFVLPHVLETSGTITTTPGTLDTELFMTYTAGLPGTPSGAGASVDLYLFTDTGTPMTNNGTTVCGPCSFTLGSGTPAARKQSVRIDDLITAQGAFDAASKIGFGVLVVGGADPDNVNLQSFVVNAHATTTDLSVFGFNPEEIRAAAN